MTSIRNALIAGVGALGLAAASLPAEAASAPSKTIAGVDCSQYQSEAFELGGEYSTDCDIDQEFTPGGRGAMHCMAFTKEGKIVAVKGWCQD